MSNKNRAPILVLGVGDTSLGDQGVGIHLLNYLSMLSRRGDDWGGVVELFDGGTQKLHLLGAIAGRSALIVLDAVSLGCVPGTVYMRRDEDVLNLGFRASAEHDGNAGELLATVMSLGELPGHVFLVGIEPSPSQTAIGLSERVRRAIPAALEAALYAVEESLASQPNLRPQFAGVSLLLQSVEAEGLGSEV